MGQTINRRLGTRSISPVSPSSLSNMAEDNGVDEILNGKTEEISVGNEECDENEKGTLSLKLTAATIKDKSVGKVASFYKYPPSPFSMLDFPGEKKW